MTKTGLSPLDPSSFSRPGKWNAFPCSSSFVALPALRLRKHFLPELAVITNISITLGVNFADKIFTGTADLTVRKIQPDADEVVGSYLVNR